MSPPPAGDRRRRDCKHDRSLTVRTFVSVAERVRRPWSISARSSSPVTPVPDARPFADDPAFKDFFDPFFGAARGAAKIPSAGLGSGVIIDNRGLTF